MQTVCKVRTIYADRGPSLSVSFILTAVSSNFSSQEKTSSPLSEPQLLSTISPKNFQRPCRNFVCVSLHFIIITIIIIVVVVVACFFVPANFDRAYGLFLSLVKFLRCHEGNAFLLAVGSFTCLCLRDWRSLPVISEIKEKGRGEI